MEPFYITPDLYASKSKRFFNFIIDYVARILLIVIIAFVIAFVAALMGNNSVLDSMEHISTAEEYLIGIVGMLIYYTFLESLFGISIGKLITGTKVVRTDGDKPTFGNALARTFCRMIPFNAFSGLAGSQFWHDSITDTVVVNAKAYDREKYVYENTFLDDPITGSKSF